MRDGGPARGNVEFAERMERMTRLTQRLWPGRYRRRLLGEQTGTVLDLGAGTGANLPHLRTATRVLAIEPDPAMRRLLRTHLAECPAPVRVVAASGERLPLRGASVDAVVCTLVLCSVPDLAAALAEVRRVLRPSGRLVYLEHVRARGWWGRVQDRSDARWQERAAGCHINRDIGASIREAGFTPLWDERIRPVLNVPLSSPLICGVAVPTGT